MKTYSLYVFVLLLTSCTFGEKAETQAMDTLPKSEAIDTSIQSIPTGSSTVVSEDFFDLAAFIDSSGYLFHFDRFKKTYGGTTGRRPFTFRDKLFYELESVPFTKGGKSLGVFLGMSDSSMIDSVLMKQAERVVQYHFEIKSPSSNLRPDGIVEEWTCPDAATAKKIGEELGAKESYSFINRGAYICYKANHVYVFHSRAAGFYTPLKNFFEYFVQRKQATAAHDGNLRMDY